jgi:hypothetical protein
MFKDMQMTRFDKPDQILGLLDLISDARLILPENPSLLEIGVWNGESSVLFASLTHDLYAIDSFEHYATADPVTIPMVTEATIRMFEIVQHNFKNLVPYSTLFKTSSEEYFSPTRRVGDKPASKPYYDMIYIDGEHTAAGVERDIRASLLLNPTILSGHDYSLPGVQSALKAALKGQKIKTYRDDSWMVI